MAKDSRGGDGIHVERQAREVAESRPKIAECEGPAQTGLKREEGEGGDRLCLAGPSARGNAEERIGTSAARSCRRGKLRDLGEEKGGTVRCLKRPDEGGSSGEPQLGDTLVTCTVRTEIFTSSPFTRGRKKEKKGCRKKRTVCAISGRATGPEARRRLRGRHRQEE